MMGISAKGLRTSYLAVKWKTTWNNGGDRA